MTNAEHEKNLQEWREGQSEERHYLASVYQAVEDMEQQGGMALLLHMQEVMGRYLPKEDER